MSVKIKKGDKVFVLTGKDRGKTGTVNKVMPVDAKVVIEGINVMKKTVKGSKENPRGGIIEKPMPLRISNVQIICGACGKSTKIGYKVLKSGKKERVCKKCGQVVKE